MARYADVRIRIGKEAVADAPGGNVTVNIPGPVVKDEIIIVGIVSDDNVSSSSSGYTAKIETNAGTTCRATVLYKRAAGGETTVVITHTAGETIAAIALVARGVVKTGDPFEAAAATGTQNSATVTFPSITTLTPKALVLAFGGLTTDEDTSGAAVWGAMSGEGAAVLTSIYSFTNGLNTDTVSMGLYRGWQNQPDATTQRTVTIAGGIAAQDQVGTVLALTPETLPDQVVLRRRRLAPGSAAFVLAERLDLTAGFRFLIHAAGGAVNTQIDPANASMVFGGQGPRLDFGNMPAPASMVFTAQTQRLQFGLMPVNAAMVFTAQGPVLASVLNPVNASMVFSGQTPSLGIGLIPAAASMIFTGQLPTIAVGTLIQPAAGSMVFTGQAPALAFVLNPANASMVFAGQTPVLAMVLMPANAAMTFTPSQPRLDFVIVPAFASMVMTAQGPMLALTLVPGAASIVFTGQLPTVQAPVVLSPAAATMVFTGQLADVIVSAPSTGAPSLIFVDGRLAVRVGTRFYIRI